MVYALITYSAGVMLEAVVLKQSANRMWLAAAGMTDALQLVRSGTQWLTDDGQEVEFAFLADCRAAARSDSAAATARAISSCV